MRWPDKPSRPADSNSILAPGETETEWDKADGKTKTKTTTTTTKKKKKKTKQSAEQRGDQTVCRGTLNTEKTADCVQYFKQPKNNIV